MPAILIAVAALVLQPQPVMCQSGTVGNIANDIFGALFGAGAGEGLGCLVQGCSSSSNPDWSTVSTQLSTLSTQLTQLNGSVQAVNCALAKDTYANFVALHTGTLTAIPILAADLANIAADRKAGDTKKLKNDLIQLKIDQKGVALSTIHADMNAIIRGTAQGTGGVEIFSNQFTACHTYFNNNDFLQIQEQWALFALMQANACVIKINLDNSANGDPADDIAACKAYQLDLNAAQVPQMRIPTGAQYLQANAFIDIKSGLGWQIGNTINASCQKLWDNGGGHAFTVCSIPGLGRSGAPWQLLPYYKDVQTLLNDSGCPATGQPTCLASKGWPVSGTSFWADSAYSNVIDPSPKGPWAPYSYCEANNCKCANGDCYDWYNVIYQDTSGNTVPSFPPCWTSVVGDPTPAGLVAWECGVVDAAAAGFNPVGQPSGALSLSEWVGSSASPAQFPTGYFWTGAPPFPAPYVAAARQQTAGPRIVETTAATEMPAAAPERER